MSIEQKKLILNCPKVTFSEKGKAKLLLSEQLCKLEDTVSMRYINMMQDFVQLIYMILNNISIEGAYIEDNK